ncbi:MAG: hypothetical protein HY791_09605 [Deltaproteobacteria bacterium]|nr:hypothetical protein [Deltaproteobacteria bacterium]
MTIGTTPNIGDAGARKRRTRGYLVFALSAVAFVILIVTGMPPAWRATLFAPLLLAFLYVLQAREKT